MRINKGFSLALGTGVWLALAIGNLGCASSTPPPASTPSSTTSTSTAPDSDNDGVADSVDKCPAEKEDGQEPFPRDGCPK